MQRAPGVDHHRDLVGHAGRGTVTAARRLGVALAGRGLGTVVQPARVEGDEALVDAGPAEELAAVVEDHLVVVDVAVEERQPERLGVGLHRAGGEGADDEAARHPRRVGRRGQVVAGRDDGPDGVDGQAHRGQVALPAHHVAGVERIGHPRVLVAPLHDDHELAGLVDRLGLGHLDHRRVEQGVASEEAAVGQLEAGPDGLDGQQVGRLDRLEAEGGAAGHDQVVAWRVGQRPVLGAEGPAAVVDEPAQVAVDVAEELVAPARQLQHPDGHLLVPEQDRGPEVVGPCERAGVVGPVDGGALDRRPAGRGVEPVQVRGRAVEAVAAVLLLDGARREADVGLAARRPPLPLRRHVGHGATGCRGRPAGARWPRTAP